MTDEENKQLTQEVWMVHNIYGRGYKDAIDEIIKIVKNETSHGFVFKNKEYKCLIEILERMKEEI